MCKATEPPADILIDKIYLSITALHIILMHYYNTTIQTNYEPGNKPSTRFDRPGGAVYYTRVRVLDNGFTNNQ